MFHFRGQVKHLGERGCPHRPVAFRGADPVPALRARPSGRLDFQGFLSGVPRRASFWGCGSHLCEGVNSGKGRSSVGACGCLGPDLSRDLGSPLGVPFTEKLSMSEVLLSLVACE